MEDVFAKIFFAHMFGDYLFQTKKMALLKSAKSLQGVLWCTGHCAIYTACFALLFQTINPIFLLLVFFSHWPIDYWSWGQKWLDAIGGRSFVKTFDSKDKYREIDIVFSCIVYTATDNVMHLFLVWLIAKTLF